jgi:hypothetical protein
VATADPSPPAAGAGAGAVAGVSGSGTARSDAKHCPHHSASSLTSAEQFGHRVACMS